MPSHRHSHVVPAGYLRSWCSDGLLGVGRRDGGPTARLPPRAVGVRSRFYRERFPDGTASDWLDPAMGLLEAKALPIIREAEQHWPPSSEERGRISEYVALQLVRTPSWREWYARALDNAAHIVREQHPERGESSYRDATEFMASDQERHRRMIENLPAMGTVFANMRWTLLRCGAPRLATSDHPVVPVGTGSPRIQPVAAVPSEGILRTAEVRFALTPRLLLLMTWHDDFDVDSILKMSIDQVRNHNGGVMAQADEHWFHHPDRRPESVSGPWPLISTALFGAIPERVRRHQVQHQINEMTQRETPERDIRLIEWGGPRQAA